MFDEIFDGSPKEKCFEVIFHANPGVVSTQLEILLDELAAFRAKEQNSDLQTAQNDIYIELMSNILSNNE